MSDARSDGQGLEDGPGDAAFRSRGPGWLAVNAPGDPAPSAGRRRRLGGDDEATRAWQAQLVDAGLAAVEWPPEYGGRTAPPANSPSSTRSWRRPG